MPSFREKAHNYLLPIIAVFVVAALAAPFAGLRLHLFDAESAAGLLLAVMFTVLLAMVLAYRAWRRRGEIRHTEELLEMQRVLDKTARRYKSLLEGAGNAIFVFNGESGALEEVNRRATELLGYDKEEMARLHGRDLVPVEELEKFTALVLRVRREGRARSEGLGFLRKDGARLLVAIDARLIDLGDQRLVHVIVRDITFKRQAELEIRQRNRELSILNNILARANQNLQLQTVLKVTLGETIEVFNVGGGVIHLLNPDGKTLRLAATHNISPTLGAQIEHCGLSTEHRCHVAITQHCHAADDLKSVGCTIGALAADDVWNSAAACPLVANNRLIGIMHLFADNHRRFTTDEMRFLATIGGQIGIAIENAQLFEALTSKSAELMRSYRLLEKSSHQLALSQNRLRKNLALVEKANFEMERLDRMKNHFLGMVSHEFKTPLTSILSGAEFLLASKEGQSEDDRQVLEMIRSGGERLSDIVSDILKITRLEARSMPMARAMIHLSSVFDYVVTQLTPLAQERGISLNVVNSTDLPHFSGDRESIEDIFAELLENAIKFTPDGGEIVMAARLASRALLEDKQGILSRFNDQFYQQMDDDCYLEAWVRDSGIGIAYDEQRTVFDKFYEIGDIRHHSTGSHKFQGKGAGLGLAIVKGMVEAHGGMVWVESYDGEITGGGSSFHVLLPLEEKIRQPAFPFVDKPISPPPPAENEDGD